MACTSVRDQCRRDYRWIAYDLHDDGRTVVFFRVAAVGLAATALLAVSSADAVRAAEAKSLSVSACSWRLVRLNIPKGSSLTSVVVTSARDAWAVGGQANDTVTLVMHWDGHTWRVVPEAGVPGLLQSVSATDSRDVWAVGYTDYGWPIIEL
jgi:hypothetical protein